MAATLGELATRTVITATPETTAAQAARLMREEHVGSLVVLGADATDAKPIGILTDRDLVLAVMAEQLDPALFTVGDVMSVQLVTAAADDDLLQAVALMRQHRVRRLIVLEPDGRLAGVVTLEDLLEALARELGGLVLAVRSARERERTERR